MTGATERTLERRLKRTEVIETVSPAWREKGWKYLPYFGLNQAFMSRIGKDSFTVNYGLGAVFDSGLASALSPVAVFPDVLEKFRPSQRRSVTQFCERPREGQFVLSQTTVPLLLAGGARILALVDVGMLNEANNISRNVGDAYLRDIVRVSGEVLTEYGGDLVLARATTGDEFAVLSLSGRQLSKEELKSLQSKIKQEIREEVVSPFNIFTDQGERFFVSHGRVTFEPADKWVLKPADTAVWEKYKSGDEAVVTDQHPEVWDGMSVDFARADASDKGRMVDLVRRRLIHPVVERTLLKHNGENTFSYRDAYDFYFHLQRKGWEKGVFYWVDLPTTMKSVNQEGGRLAGDAVVAEGAMVLNQAIRKFYTGDLRILFSNAFGFVLPFDQSSGPEFPERIVQEVEQHLRGRKTLPTLEGAVDAFFLAGVVSQEVDLSTGPETFFQTLDQLREKVWERDAQNFRAHFLGPAADFDFEQLATVIKPYIETAGQKGSSRRGPRRVADWLQVYQWAEKGRVALLSEFKKKEFYDYDKIRHQYSLKRDKLEEFKQFMRERVFAIGITA